MSRRLLSAVRGIALLQEPSALLARDSTFGRTLSVHLRDKSSSTAHAPTVNGAATVNGSSLHFEDHEAIFKGQSTGALLRSLAVFTACTIPGFVEAAPTLLNLSRSWLGERATMEIIRRTFFAQFCGGEDESSLQGKVRELRDRGIGSILDYAAEDDIPTPVVVPAAAHTSTPSASQPHTPPHANPFHPAVAAAAAPVPAVAEDGVDQPEGMRVVLAVPPGPAVARQYCYESEGKCDAHVVTFLSSIASAGRMPGQGFAAVKLTALGNPLLLKRVSTAIRVVRGMFAQWDTDGNQVIDRSEFEAAYRQMLPDASPEEQERVFEWMNQQKGDKIDYVSWCQRVSLTKMPELAARIAASNISVSASGEPATSTGGVWRESLHSAALTPEEVDLVKAMRGRLRKLAAAAAEAKVNLLVDAEHSFFQPAIDHLCLELARIHNRGPEGAIIYNTYQAYLTDTPSRLVVDLERARREHYVLGAKLVRGAYMEIERDRALTKGYESPVWPTIEETHRTYNECAKVLLQAAQSGRAEVLFGTHNQQSIELVVHEMAKLGLDPVSSKVYFGQLLGMADHLTQVLGSNGFQAFKYVPYGAIDLVVPYLLRRATENASIMKGSKRDVTLLKAELFRRAKAAVGLAK